MTGFNADLIMTRDSGLIFGPPCMWRHTGVISGKKASGTIWYKWRL